jgi:hypothetical protein
LPFGGDGEHGVAPDDRGHLVDQRPQRGDGVEVAAEGVVDDLVRLRGGGVVDGPAQGVAVAVTAVDGHAHQPRLVGDALAGLWWHTHPEGGTS